MKTSVYQIFRYSFFLLILLFFLGNQCDWFSGRYWCWHCRSSTCLLRGRKRNRWWWSWWSYRAEEAQSAAITSVLVAQVCQTPLNQRQGLWSEAAVSIGLDAWGCVCVCVCFICLRVEAWTEWRQSASLVKDKDTWGYLLGVERIPL